MVFRNQFNSFLSPTKKSSLLSVRTYNRLPYSTSELVSLKTHMRKDEIAESTEISADPERNELETRGSQTIQTMLRIIKLNWSREKTFHSRKVQTVVVNLTFGMRYGCLTKNWTLSRHQLCCRGNSSRGSGDATNSGSGDIVSKFLIFSDWTRGGWNE